MTSPSPRNSSKVVKRALPKVTLAEIGLEQNGASERSALAKERARPTSQNFPKPTSAEVRAALIQFYNTHDPAKVPTVDNFVSWIETYGVDAFNVLLHRKYGEALPLGSGLGGREDSSRILQFDSSWVQTLGSSKYAFLGALLVSLSLYLYAFGHLALANLMIFCLGWTITWRHLDGRSEKRALSPVLHVFWSLFGLFFLMESLLPLSLVERPEYTLLKCMLFGYLYLPDRLFKEQKSLISSSNHSGDVIRVRLVTVLRDLALFCLEACLVFYFSRQEGHLGFQEVMILGAVAAVYLFATSSLKRRDLVVEELFLTEEQYSNHLKIFKRYYVPALGNVATAEEMDILTRHVESISTLSELITNELRTAMAKDLVGPAFEKFIPFLRMYAPFCADHEAKRELLAKIRERKQVVDALESVLDEGSNDKVQSIESYLIMPVQRVPRYALLLAELIKHTPRWHPDYEPCVGAHAQVEEVARYINEAIQARATGQTCLSPTNRVPSTRIAISRTASTSSTTSAISAS